ncbi:ARM repeat superfamily protein [Forsythia ovata]|uniref:ARM repeat superfamily protein n=1 Tax=Forsythia ovata TaxID=205694 RepID=A0ABD1WPZ1_9LAMI
MEKRLRSSLQTSGEEFLSAAAKLPLKSSKPILKTLINSQINQSNATSTLPISLLNSISHSISLIKNLSNSNFTASPKTPPAKRRRSLRNKTKDDEVSDSPTKDRENLRQNVVEKLQIYAYILHLCVFHPKNLFPASDLLAAAQELHDNMILFESDSVLLSEIASLCEEWWKGDLLGKENLISQSLPVVLSRSLTLKKKVDVHRVYTLREAFTLFDFEDESIEDLKHLLIRCIISPLYLKTEDGRKFIAFMFGLSGQLAKEAFAMMKSQIPFGRKSMLEGYGEIMFRAWKAVEGECKDEIESVFLQELVEGAIHASLEAFAASIRKVLGAFVNQRTVEGVEKLIFHLAEPVIFRSLQVANSNVRQNALHLLLDLFPLEDPDATKEVKDTLLEKQFFLLEKLLMDECPDVRVVAVEGCCRILHLFWEVIPSPTITKIITRIFDHMTYDACTDVRFSTVNGVIYLLGNPQSHEVLKVLLPRLGHLILDSASNIRASVTDLLLLLKDIRKFQFHKVVHLDALLSMLAIDQPLIARKITKLLLPSYFPAKVTEEEACKRFVTLIKRSPAAGARFCEFAVSEGASPRSLMKLLKVLISLTLSPVKLSDKHIEGLLVAASHICDNLVKVVSLRKVLKEELSSEKLRSLFAIAATTSAQSSVCNIISTISPDAVDGLFEECMALITKCSSTSSMERQAEVRSAHKMMLVFNWFHDMFEALVGLLQKAAHGCHVKFGIELGKQDVHSAKWSKSKFSNRIASKSRFVSRKKSSNTVKHRFDEDYAIASGIAWQIKDLLLSETTRKAILGSEILESTYLALKVISEASIVHSMKFDYMNSSPVSAYIALTLHMSLENVNINGSKDLDSKNMFCPDSVGSSPKKTVSDLTIDHLLHCTYKLLRASDYNKSGKSRSESLRANKMAPDCEQDSSEHQTGSALAKQVRMSNVVKMLTAVLKFVVDANTLNLLAPCHPERCLKFTMEYLKFIDTNLRKYSICQQQFTEEGLKETFLCLKSSFTYAAKLLNVVLKSSEAALPKLGAYNLVNELFNLIISVEEYLGHGYASRFVTSIKPWVPDLILAFGSCHLLMQIPEESVHSTPSENGISTFPSWFSILAKIELHEITDIGSDEGTHRDPNSVIFSAFKRLLEMITEVLKSNDHILDSVGAIFLAGSLHALESKNFDLVLGLLHFICVKLVKHKDEEWKKLKLMSISLEEIYHKVEVEAEEPSNGEDDRQILQSVRELLEPVWISCIYHGRHTMEEE